MQIFGQKQILRVFLSLRLGKQIIIKDEIHFLSILKFWFIV